MDRLEFDHYVIDFIRKEYGANVILDKKFDQSYNFHKDKTYNIKITYECYRDSFGAITDTNMLEANLKKLEDVITRKLLNGQSITIMSGDI